MGLFLFSTFDFVIDYEKTNRFIGGVVFALALLVYILTLETWVSFWDCGEFIAAGYKLQVTHPPGAPLYHLLGRFFSLFAFGNTALVALCINLLSTLSSAFCVLLTYLITTRIAQKLINPLGVAIPLPQYISIWGAGAVAAFTLAFSDTFWFSAVEAEVYSLSSLILFLTVWAALKWEENKSSVSHVRWLVLIAFLVGLSTGVHLLNLLVLPAVVAIIYLGAYGYSFFNLVKATLLGIALLLFIQVGIIQGLPFLIFIADKWLVNTYHFALGSGFYMVTTSAVVLLLGLLLFSKHKKLKTLHVSLLCLGFVLIGFSSYLVVPIRAMAQPSLNNSKADNAASFLSYINREQYGGRALLYGPAFNAPITKFKKGKPVWRINEKGSYAITNYKTDYEFDDEFMMWFPRVGDIYDESSVDGYVGWTQLDPEKPPTQLKNWEFFFKYQFLHMYVRYHLWNFAGRQNDHQGHGNAMDGNSESGIGFIDRLISAPYSSLPKSLENKAKNHYYFLPLLLGIAGLLYHLRKSKESFTPLLILFLFTGVFLCFYLNIPPFEPRERDYVFVGSFQVFSIWVGLGVFWFCRMLRKFLPKGIWIGLIIGFFAAPLLLLIQNWDDHNRKDRTFAKDYALNMLRGLEPNSILFVKGDNDTYPLWYLQEVEGFRTDVRVINTNLLGSNWGAFELETPCNASKPLKLTISAHKYQMGTRGLVRATYGEPKALQSVLHFAKIDSNTFKLSSGKERIYLPTHKLVLPNKDTVTVSGSHVSRSDLIMLDVIANNPNRSIYFASRGRKKSVPFLSEYLQNKGLVHQLALNSISTQSTISQEIQKWRLFGFDLPAFYLDPEAKKIGKHYVRAIVAEIERLLKQDQVKQAETLATFCSKKFPVEYSAFSSYKHPIVVLEAFFAAKNRDRFAPYLDALVTRLTQEANYYRSIQNTISHYSATKELKQVKKSLRQLQELLLKYEQKEKAQEIEKFLSFFAV